MVRHFNGDSNGQVVKDGKQYILYITGWWFGTFVVFPYIGNFILPIDFHIFQRGGPATNQIIWVKQSYATQMFGWFIPAIYELGDGYHGIG